MQHDKQETTGFASLCVREPEDPRTTRPHQLPIYATSSFAFDSLEQGMRVFRGEEQGHLYSRFGNPTIDAVAGKIAQLESYGTGLAANGMLVSSGMSAISTLLMSLLQPGDKVLTQGNIYGGTMEQFNKLLSHLGFVPVYVDLSDLNQAEQALKEHAPVRVIYIETPANPTLACVDLEAMSKLAKKYGCTTVCDNTFCTPYIQQPLRWGIDYVVHSTTKYLNGHGNSTSGAIIGSDASMMQGRIWQVMKLAGTNCNPWDAWLLHNGMKTLALRMERHSSNALAVAQWLERHPAVAHVNYVGLPSHPHHRLARKQMNGGSGMLSFELKGGLDAGKKLMNSIQFCTMAPTMGDVDTLVMHPASMSHLNIPADIRRANGISDGLIRLSVGIEDVADILADLSGGMFDV